MNCDLYFIVPFIGYAGLWVLASPLFVGYFKLFHIPIDLKHTVRMLKQLPTALAIATVPVCSFVSFFITTKAAVHLLPAVLTAAQTVGLGLVSLIVTIILDMLITVLGEKIDIHRFPVNLMYLCAWAVIVPAVILGR